MKQLFIACVLALLVVSISTSPAFLLEGDQYVSDSLLEEINEAVEEIVGWSNPTYDPVFAKQMVYASGLAYCTVKQVEKWSCGTPCKNLNGWSSYYSSESVKFSTLTFFILVNDATKQVAFTFRGTHSADQLVAEVLGGFGKAYSTPYWNVAGAQAQIYFQDRYTEKFQSQVFANLKTLGTSSRKDYQYIFTGHSLGGALATLAAIDGATSKFIPVKANSPYLITYGSPRVGNYAFAMAVNSLIPVMFRVTHYNDVVPHVPLCEKWDLFNECIAPKSLDPKFRKEAQVSENPVGAAYWYAWHVKQEIFYNFLNTKYDVCSQTNSEDKKCSDGLLVYDVLAHLDYLGLGIGTMCALI